MALSLRQVSFFCAAGTNTAGGKHQGSIDADDAVRVPTVCAIIGQEYAVQMAPRIQHHMSQDPHFFDDEWNCAMALWRRYQHNEGFITVHFNCTSLHAPHNFNAVEETVVMAFPFVRDA